MAVAQIGAMNPIDGEWTPGHSSDSVDVFNPATLEVLAKVQLARREENSDEIARLTTQENGETLAESQAELPRGLENIEVACGIPTLMQGYNLEDISSGIDEIAIRQPLLRYSRRTAPMLEIPA